MMSGDRVARHALVTLLAAAAWLLPCAARAAPGCDIGDILNDGGNALSAVASPACDASYATGVGITAVAAITAALEIISGSGGGGTVNNVCNDLNTVKDDAAAIGQWLTAANVSSQTVDDIVGALNSSTVVDPLNVATCACSIEQGVNQFLSDLGDCLCDLVSWIPGVNCNSCTPPPPVQADCALPANCFVGSSDPACQTNNAITGCITVVNATICPASTTPGSTGTFVSEPTGDPNCPTMRYCFCPKPLVPTWTPMPSLPPSFTGPTTTNVFTCACPNGTYQAGTAGGVPICLCDYTNQPPKVADTPQGMCPINLVGNCQPNQIVIKGQCVTPCQDPTQGMTPDGACCDPNQLTACGQCCPPGKRPVNGTCVGPGPIQ